MCYIYLCLDILVSVLVVCRVYCWYAESEMLLYNMRHLTHFLPARVCSSFLPSLLLRCAPNGL
ncbi:hypothetical protein AG1IA_04144 [Rhizoctonia solani AG-1 IA]|uniref:Uncharacterized protein n=1 Tax=Thanatephorus cucumeris (strain AG1-IA) TaxID=983506 RepID=L8WZP8_THACA|nr:hypothetical protein AG1IA_04144 [Rhizoctonia solani AG-1 IA]